MSANFLTTNRKICSQLIPCSRITKRFSSVVNAPSEIKIVQDNPKEQSGEEAQFQLQLKTFLAREKRSKRSPKRPANKGINSAISAYVGQRVGPTLSSFGNQAILSKLSAKVLKSTKTIPTNSYLIDGSVAAKYAKLVKQDSPDLQSPVVEISPGIGLLTNEILKLGFTAVSGLEAHTNLIKFLKEERKLPVEVLPKGLYELPRLHHVDKIDGGNRLPTLLSQIRVNNKDKKEQKRNLLVFGAIPNVSLINFIIRSLVTGRVFYEDEFDWEDPVYYVALSSKAHWILSAQPHSGYFVYRASSVLFQLLFNYKILGELPRAAWVPWINDSKEGKSNKYKIRNDYNDKVSYLVKIETNQELIKILGKDQLLPFWYFVRQHLLSRRNLVIQELEQWVPGCGTKLVREGFTIYSQFGSLTPQQILELYLKFTSWPEFGGCSFGAAVEKFQSRLDMHEEDVH